jgi:hypothetical protein
MPTSFLNLTTNTQASGSATTFLTWRLAMNDESNSNMSKIDTFAQNISASVVTLQAEVSYAVNATESTTNNYIATVTGFTSYTDKKLINLMLDVTQTGTTTLNINSLGTKTLCKIASNGVAVNLDPRDLIVGRPNMFVYNVASGYWLWVNATSADQINISGNPNEIVVLSPSGSGLASSGFSASNLVTASLVAPSTASYVVFGSLNSTLTNDKMIIAGSGISFNNNTSASTLSIDSNIVAGSHVYLNKNTTASSIIIDVLASNDLQISNTGSGVLTKSGSALPIVSGSYYNAFPGMCKDVNCNLRVVYRVDTSHVGTKGSIYTKTSSDNGTTWSSASLIASDGTYDLRDPSVSLVNNNRLIVSYFLYGIGVGQVLNGVYIKYSDDNGVTWSAAVQVANGFTQSVACSAPVLKLSNGNLLLPMYGKNTGDTLHSSAVSISTDNGLTWSHLSYISVGTNGDSYEPNIIDLGGGKLYCLTRTDNALYDMLGFYSYDNAITWTMKRLEFAGSGAPRMLFTSNKMLFVFYRQTINPVGNIVYRVSNNQANSWGSENVLEASAYMMEYASAVEISPNSIGICYSYQTSASQAPIVYQNATISKSNGNVSFDNLPYGTLPVCDDGSIANDFVAWNQYLPLLKAHVSAGRLSTKTVLSTFSLAYTAGAYNGGVLSPNGDIHFVPTGAAVGQKISSTGIVSTYALAYTVGSNYLGGVLDPNGNIHFAPFNAPIGQKISLSGVASTYALAYSVAGAYSGGVLAPNGDIHFVPNNAVVGQKISSAGVVSSYSLPYSLAGAYQGGVLAPNGDIHFVPRNAVVGQKISPSGTVSTYALAYTVANAYMGGVLSPNGDIHFVPNYALVGQKISIDGTVSTYPLAYSVANAYNGGVLAPNGDIHFVPRNAVVGQKISPSGTVSTYALAYSAIGAYVGGVLIPNGDIYFISTGATIGQKIHTLSAYPFSLAECCSSFFNKL